MSVFRLPVPMPEMGRLPEGKRIYDDGKTAVTDVLASCEQTIHISPLSDGTNSSVTRKYKCRWLAVLLSLGAISAMPACSQESQADASAIAGKEAVYGGGVRGLNYSRDYIHSFRVTGPRGMNGGGGNMMRAGKDGPGEAAERCCIGIPQPWQANTQLHMEWERDRKPYDAKDRSQFEALTATVTVPEYGPSTSGFWAIFLPGDRVKVIVADGNANGHNRVRVRPDDNDPFIVQGMRDEALTKDLQERHR